MKTMHEMTQDAMNELNTVYGVTEPEREPKRRGPRGMYQTDYTVTLWGRTCSLTIWAKELSLALGTPVLRRRLLERMNYYQREKGQPQAQALELAIKAITRVEKRNHPRTVNRALAAAREEGA